MIDIVDRLRDDAEGWRGAVHTESGPNVAAIEIEAAAEIKRLRERVSDAEADALRLHSDKMRYYEALLELRCRDDRNGSLSAAYRKIIDDALNQQQVTETKP